MLWIPSIDELLLSIEATGLQRQFDVLIDVFLQIKGRNYARLFLFSLVT
jgi:hypothetical protein